MNADSLSQLSGIFRDVFKETGTELSLAPFGGAETAFTLTYRGEETTVYIRGAGEETENKIKFVRYLIAGSSKEKAVGELKNILLGEGGEWDAFRFMTKNDLADGKCFAADVVPDRRFDEAFRQIERCIEGRDRKSTRLNSSHS